MILNNQILNLSNYYFNPHAVPLVIVGILILSIGSFVLQQNKKAILNIAFFLQCLSVAIWLCFMGVVYSCRTQSMAVFWYRYFTFFGVANIMPALIFLGIVWQDKFQEKKFFVLANYLLSVIFYIFAITTDKVVIPYKMNKYFWGFYPIYGWLAAVFLLIYVAQCIIGLSGLYAAYKKEKPVLKKTHIKTMAIATLIASTASADFIPKFFPVALYPYGYIPVFIYVCLNAYSIVRYKAFDIETVIHKTVMWLFSFSFVILPVLLLHSWFFSSGKASAALEIWFWVLSFAGLIVYMRAIQPQVDHFFQRRQANLEEISSRFAEEIVYLKGLSPLVERIRSAIQEAFYPKEIGIFIHSKELKGGPQFLAWLARYNKIVYRDFIEMDPACAGIKEKANEYFNTCGAQVVVPLILDGKLLGIINLSKKASLKRYTAADFYFLNLLKNQAVVAVSNSLLYENMEEQVRQRTQELAKAQNQLVHAEKLATIGTLAGGVAHEINNPLTAVLTNTQMLLMDVNPQDTDTKESLELIEEATKRCRTIVQKLMTYAKKPLEKVEALEFNLLKAAQNVISFLKYQLEQEDIKVVLNAKEEVYLIAGNQSEMEQVLTNMILNARDAIKRMKVSGTVEISIVKLSGKVKVDIKDDGEGMAQGTINRIFDPFFTTKDVGKGLGLGLSICQSIVEKHKGVIRVCSELRHGSVFILEFPSLDRQEVSKDKANKPDFVYVS